MKKYLIVALALFCSFNAATAQHGSERREERIKAFRIAIYTEKLNLTSEEAQAFWPIYNEFVDKRDVLQDQAKPAKRLDEMTDAELEAQIVKHLERQQKELDLEKEMITKLRKVLPLRKLAKLPTAEREFREAIFKKIQERKAEKQQDRN
jgi:hypothetical protein